MAGITEFQSQYSQSPIYLVAGIAGQGQLGIDTILNPLVSSGGGGGSGSALVASGATTGAGGAPDASSGASAGLSYVNFGIFSVLPGGTLMDNEIAHYPLANQAVAGNAVITQQLKISLEMTAPAYDEVPFSLKQTIFTALKSVLDQHTALGGYYMVYTPAFIYNNCLLETLVDGSDDSRGSQPQVRWIWNFEQPLLTVQQGQAAQSQAAARITNASYNTGDPPGSTQVSTGSNSLGNQKVVSSASNVGSVGTVATPANLSSVSPILPGGFA